MGESTAFSHARARPRSVGCECCVGAADAQVVSGRAPHRAPCAREPRRTSARGRAPLRGAPSPRLARAMEVHRAARMGWEAGLRGALANGESPNAVDQHSQGQQPLLYAAESGHTSCVLALLAAGASPGACAWNGVTPLLAAATGGHEACVRALLAAGAVADAAGPLGRSPLHAALPHEASGVVRALLDAGADVEVADKKGFSPLHWCASDGHVAAAQLLLDRGADVEAVAANGWTPLHLAANNAQENMVKLLLGAGADPLAKGTDDNTPRDVAATDELVRILGAAANRSDGFAQGADPAADGDSSAAAAAADATAALARTEEQRGTPSPAVGTRPQAQPAPGQPDLEADGPSAVASALIEALGFEPPAFLSKGWGST